MTTATLTGSEKQIEWATNIREALVPVLARTTARTIATLEGRGLGDLAADVRTAHESILGRISAAWWIEHRGNLSTSVGISGTSQILVVNALPATLSDEQRDAIVDVIDGY